MNRVVDLTNQRFGRLLVIKSNKKRLNKHVVWLCHCDCGNFTEVRSCSLRSGVTKSCGCLFREMGKKRTGSLNFNFKHGGVKTKLYKVWRGMKDRCYNSKDEGYYYYGKRGINICDEWLSNFTAFRDWASLSGYKAGLTIDRINNDGNYCPENCQWVTVEENSRKSAMIRWHGEYVKN